MLSPLSPSIIWLDEIDIRYSNLTGANDDKYDIEVDTGVSKRKDELSFRVSLEIRMFPANKSHTRYELIKAKVTGIFDFPPDTDVELVKKLVPLNCFAILHGYLRGILAQITGLNPGGPVMLPAVNFFAVMEQQRAKKTASKRSVKPISSNS